MILFTDYQSAETAWRYNSQRSSLQRSIEDAEKALERLRATLAELESKPPRYELFNWSA